MTPSLRVRHALRQAQPTLPIAAISLGHAVWHVRPPAYTHAVVLDQLPTFIEAELERRATAVEFRELKHHLLVCASCVKIYLDLLHIAELEAHHSLPRPSTRPNPDLTFLESDHE
ncbi:MAG TPA: hypothetical protein VFD70_15750 [Anaerolineae bacterium]|nr:hypothetical protein [Anaerolineae bacterium]